jgi:aerobic-type carbon monoxide dehydrogenase small subunit (CoxS/CutS family)
VRFALNGKPRDVKAAQMKRLLDVLREECGLTGTKEGCGEGECGACSVLIGDRVVNSCLVPLCQVEGEEVTTVEGLSSGRELSSLQRAFVERGAAQCGICTPGFLLAAESLLRRNGAPTLEEVRVALAGNLCRCTGYVKIYEAVLGASRGEAP